MSDIAPIGRPHVPVVTGGERLNRIAPPQASEPRETDRVELSAAAQWLSKLQDLPVRQDKIDRAKQEIAAGTLDSDRRIEGAIDELTQDL